MGHLGVRKLRASYLGSWKPGGGVARRPGGRGRGPQARWPGAWPAGPVAGGVARRPGGRGRGHPPASALATARAQWPQARA
jgi:hypothetical protein